MRGAWRVADVRAAEAALMATLPPGTLMRRAAAGLARRCAGLLVDRFGGVYGRRVLLLVGSGDNGGDALYAGAALARRGATVTARLLSADRVHRDGLAALRRAGGRVATDGLPDGAELVVDGIVGIGATGGLREPVAALVAAAVELTAADGAPALMVAVDVPSGVDVDTGDVPGAAVRADVTVTFGCQKPALVAGPAAQLTGVVELVDIGLGPYLRTDPVVQVPDLADVAGWWPRPGPASDKYTRGVVGVSAGSPSYPGAGMLAVAGAVAGPAGMVRYAGPAAEAVVARYPSVIPAPRVADAGRTQAWVCGCGLGTDERAAAELRAVLERPVPVVLDADALTLLAGGGFTDALRSRKAPVVLTPHDREYARLAGAEPGGDRVAAARRLATQLSVTVLLKGDRTVVADPDGHAYVNPTGHPALATAGTGDVLAGLLGSLLAAGLAPWQAALTAAYLHGLAARRAAAEGPVTAPVVAAALRPPPEVV